MIHDVAVLGGGIAGATAALRLAQAGLEPAWIAPTRGDGFKPGEHLSAAALPLLKALGSDAILRSEVHRHAHGTYSAWGSDTLVERNAIVQLEGPPTVLDRGAFEDALTTQAITSGAQRIDQTVTEVVVQEDRWRIETLGGAIAARFVFDATGRKALVASRYATRFQADKLACQYALFAAPDAESARPVTLIEAEERGWWYMSLLADGQAVLNFYTDTDLPCFETSDLETQARGTTAIATYLADYGYRMSSRPTRIATNSTWIAPAIGAGWAAIGDAAAAYDPLSSHGMTTALWSAMTAADAYIARSRRKMQDYADNVARGVQDYLSARSAVYARETRWPDSPFWARRRANLHAGLAPAAAG
ncbi:glycine oxidase maturase GoxB [Tateyamaria omphalii]|uniref:glycine oxidase maturase GoxB n=1 Tax=Tateyamaria omphalii TaxID=299262 RepID=UPI001C9A245A|nr:glycine oxidase maturase GoxB [Tateyamaria omphalii]MBY5933553.1 glycine oxidase maturase GoxB [Tateyamaria omphalii]